MKKVVLHSVYAFILFQVTVITLYHFTTKGLRYYNKPVYEQFDLLFNKSEDQDLLFIGSSRTHYGVNSLLLENLTGKKVLNAGLEGAKINEMEIVLTAFLANHSNPEKIFLMLDPHSLDIAEAGIYNKLYYASYLHNEVLYKHLRSALGREVAFWKHLPYSVLTNYDDYTRSNCLRGLANKSYLTSDQYSYKGYISLNKTYKAEDSLITIKNSLNESGMSALLRIAELCKKRTIPLQIVQGPYLTDFYTTNHLHTIYETIHRRLSAYPLIKTQITPLNYQETSNFKDQVHLNETGAIKYSKDLYYNFIKNDSKN